jgi:putative SOS response-associated peptidase YedK
METGCQSHAVVTSIQMGQRDLGAPGQISVVEHCSSARRHIQSPANQSVGRFGRGERQGVVTSAIPPEPIPCQRLLLASQTVRIHLSVVCNLYRVRSTASEMAALFGAVVPVEFDWKPEIYPRYTAPVIIAHADQRRIGPMTWGFPTQIQGKTKMLTKHVTNARNLASPFWKGAAVNPARRCLVPFTQFAEPRPGKDADGKPAQWWFTIMDQPTAAFAGLWRPTEAGPVFAFCTTEPNPLVAPLHPKAMPVILLPDDRERWRWLMGSYEDVLELQAPYPSQMMSVV